MNYTIAVALTLVNAGWLFLVILGLPGTWMMAVTTALVAWWRWDRAPPHDEHMFGLGVLIAITALAILGEIFEFVAGVFGSQRVGGSKQGAVGALAGTLVGGLAGTFIVPVPLLGSLVGAVLGAAIGAWAMEIREGRPMRDSLLSGAGAGVGRFLGTVGKLACGLAIWIIAAVAAFWP